MQLTRAVGLCVLVSAGTYRIMAAPSIGQTTVKPQFIPAGQPTTVTATAEITDPSLIKDSVTLVRLDSGGNSTSLGIMHDDGKNGDAKAGDNIYSLQVILNEAKGGDVNLQVTAQFKGQGGAPQMKIGMSVAAAKPAPAAFNATDPCTSVAWLLTSPAAGATPPGIGPAADPTPIITPPNLSVYLTSANTWSTMITVTPPPGCQAPWMASTALLLATVSQSPSGSAIGQGIVTLTASPNPPQVTGAVTEVLHILSTGFPSFSELLITVTTVPGGANAANLSAKSAIFKVTVIAMDRLDVTQEATPNAVDKATPAVTPGQVTNTTAAFAAADSANLMTFVKGLGADFKIAKITVNAVNVQPAANAKQIQWALERDPNDKVNLTKATGCDGAPKSAPEVSGAPGDTVSFEPGDAGNFRLVAYIDANGNKKFDDGEQLRVLRFAVVRANLLDGSTFKTTKKFTPDEPANGDAGVDANGPAMQLMADYLLEGGGADCKIGTGAITIGDVGNLVRDNFTVNYPVPMGAAAPKNQVGTAAEDPGGPLPMIDTSRVDKGSQPTGGETPFRGRSNAADVAAAAGRRIRLTSEDSPGYGFWNINHPTTTNPWGTTGGGNQFREFVVAFSSSFMRTYAPLSQGTWTVALNGKSNGTGKWVDNGSDITRSGDTLGVVMDTVQVLGLSFVREFKLVYKP